MAQRDVGNPATERHWGRYGFLVADLFTALAMLFLVANTVGHVSLPTPKPTPTPIAVAPTPTPTATPGICGLDPHPLQLPPFTVGDPAGLRAQAADAEHAFATQVHDALGDYAAKTAGLAEVSGGSFFGSADVTDGESLAQGAIDGLNLLAGQHYIFTADRTIYQPFWDGDIGSDQIRLIVFFYAVASGSVCGA